MTMIERVARAICSAQGDDWDREGDIGLMEAYGPLARAAIEAMREPTDGMVEAAEDAFTGPQGYMIAVEAALAEPRP